MGGSADGETDREYALMVAVLKAQQPCFRPMSEQDLDAVFAIEQACYDFPWSRGIFKDCLRVGYSCWVMEADDDIRGYGIMTVGAGESHILNLCLQPERHGVGFGSMLLRHLLDHARKHNATITFLEVRPSNVNAIRLYERAGFTVVGTRRGYYPAGEGREDALILSRGLQTDGAS